MPRCAVVTINASSAHKVSDTDCNAPPPSNCICCRTKPNLTKKMDSTSSLADVQPTSNKAPALLHCHFSKKPCKKHHLQQSCAPAAVVDEEKANSSLLEVSALHKRIFMDTLRLRPTRHTYLMYLFAITCFPPNFELTIKCL